VWWSKGGAMLNIIQAAASGGDERSGKMHAYLLERVRFVLSCLVLFCFVLFCFIIIIYIFLN
jgi:hypothetical protein